MALRKLIAGNWKMNGVMASLDQIRSLGPHAETARCDIMICPPATLIHAAADVARGSGIAIGGQDCHADRSGAHTGDISALQLRDAGATGVILGHSERRHDHGEDDALVRAKAIMALAAGLQVILCVGEEAEERKAGRTLDVIARQLSGSLPQIGPNDSLAIAYEPVWAIGSGLVPELAEIAEVHKFVRGLVGPRSRLLYGGSMKPENAGEILCLDHVDGGLIGGASLKASDLIRIIDACP